MDSHTFRSRLAQLMQKSRKALRLYSSMGQMHASHIQGSESAELSDLQVLEWREVNAELLKQLSVALGNPNSRRLIGDVFGIRDRFYGEWRAHESELHTNQQSLVRSAEHGDFVRAAALSKSLIGSKARMQASQAAYQELDELLRQSKVNPPTIELSRESMIEDRSVPITKAKVIPLRQRG